MGHAEVIWLEWQRQTDHMTRQPTQHSVYCMNLDLESRNICICHLLPERPMSEQVTFVSLYLLKHKQRNTK